MTLEVAERPLSNGLELLAHLEQTGAVTRVGLNLAVFDATYDQCEALITLCRQVRDVSSYVIGDVLVYSEHHFKETYAQLEAATGYAASTLANVVYVASRVPLENRRPELHPGHHAEVAKLPSREQVRWLDRAVKHGWTVMDLRAQLRKANGVPEPEAAPRSLVEAVGVVVRDAVLTDDGEHYLVPRLSYERLQALLVGE